MFIWLKFLLTQSSSTVDNALFPHTLLEDPGTWQTLSVKTGKKSVEYISFKVQRASFVTTLPALLNSKPMFSLSFHLLPVYLKKPFFTFLTGFNSSWALTYLTVPACLGCVSVSLLASLSSLPPLCTFSFVFELSQEFLDHLCWPSVMPALLSACQKGMFFYFEKAIFEDKAAHLGPLWEARAVPYENLPRHALSKPKYVVLKIQDSVLYTFLRILNATMPCLLQPRPSHSPPILPC